jgi:hypothetical protein
MAATNIGFGFQGGGSGGGGTPGPQGTPGSVWRNGSGPPSNSVGINGDYYLNNDNGFVFQKVANVYTQVAVIKGADGTNGTNGSVWYASNGAPVSSPVYNANDFYLDNDNGDVFRYDGVAWQPETNIFGTDGTNGSVWYADSGVPVNDPLIYNANDFYLNNDDGEVYQFNGTTWNQQVNIKGANGSQWFTASGVPTAIQNDGDFYLDADDGEVYQQVLGGWVDTGTNIKGANGTNGADGSIWYSGAVFPPTSPPTYNPNDFFLDTTNGNVYQYDGSLWQFQLTLSGVAGSSWFNGAGPPSVIENDGDYYLDDSNGDVYTQVSGAWTLTGNILGPAGAPGADGQDGSSSSYFLYRTNTLLVSGNPTNQKIRWNNPVQLSATELGISAITDDAVNITIFLSLLNLGDTIVIQDKNVAANYQTFVVTGSITDNTTWFSVPVTLIDNGGWSPTGEFPDNHPIFIAISREGTAGADGANSTRYGFDSASVPASPPAANRFNANNTDLTLVTRILVDYFNIDNIDFFAWWTFLEGYYQKTFPDSCVFQIRQIGKTNAFASYQIEQAVDGGTFFDLKLIYQSGQGTLDPSQTYSLSYVFAGAIGEYGTAGPNSVLWQLNASTPATGEFSYLPVIATQASAITSFTIDDTAFNGSSQFDWLEYARTTAISGSVGILSVTPKTTPYLQANFTISSVVDNTGSHTINVSFLGGADIDFTTYPAPNEFWISYVFNGAGGGGGTIGVYYPDISTPIDLATNTMVFTGGGVTVTQISASDVEINIPTAGTFGAIVASIRSLSTSTTLSPFTVGNMTIPYNGTITGWTIFSDVPCTATVDFLADPYASYPPTTSLFSGNEPNLAADDKNELSPISIPVTQGDVIQCQLTSITGTVSRIDVTLLITKS